MINIVSSSKKHTAQYYLNCLCGYRLAIMMKNCQLSYLGFFLETYSLTSYGRGWRKDVINQYLEFGVCNQSQACSFSVVPA